MYSKDNFSKETGNKFELLCTPRTVNEGLVAAFIDATDERDYYRFEGVTGSDFIIHIFEGEDGPETYLHVKSGNVVAERPFMYTKRYLRCSIGKNGRVRAIV